MLYYFQSDEYFFFCFFFQAEDGIRDLTVTGVQTCALPISHGVCAADWVVDGMPASVSSTPHLPVVGIVAVEIYRSPNEAPAEFLKADSDCGVIAIWTK